MGWAAGRALAIRLRLPLVGYAMANNNRLGGVPVPAVREEAHAAARCHQGQAETLSGHVHDLRSEHGNGVFTVTTA